MAGTKSANGRVNRIAEVAPSSGSISLKPIRKMVVEMRIAGVTPLITHKWSEDQLAAIRKKHDGVKTKNRAVRNREKEGEDAAYRTQDGRYAIPAVALKGALITAAHRDIGIERTLVKKALFLRLTDPYGYIALECDPPEIREDVVRVGQGSTDLRYRPMFHRWSCSVTWEVDGELLTEGDLCTLVNRAGFGVGIGDWRPEKGGEFGRFEIDEMFPVQVRTL